MHIVGLCERNPHGYFVTFSEQEHSSLVICVVFLRLVNHTADTAHDRVLVDVRVVSHKKRVPCVIEQLAVNEVVTRCTNHQETVAYELDTSGYVAKPPVGDAVNCRRKKQVKRFH